MWRIRGGGRPLTGEDVEDAAGVDGEAAEVTDELVDHEAGGDVGGATGRGPSGP